MAVLVGIGVVIGLVLAYQALEVLKIAAAGALLALVLRTVARGLERLGLSPFLSVLVLLVGLGSIGALVYFVITPNVAQEIRALISRGPGSLSALADSLDDLPFGPDPSEIVERLRGYLSGYLRSLPSFAIALVKEVVALVSVVFLAVYLAVSPDVYVRGLLRLVPVDRRGEAREFVDVLAARLRGWVIGTVIVASFVGVIGGLGLWILGVPLALTFGILAGILDLVPYVGSILGGALPALVAITISPTKAIEVVLLFVVVNQIEGNLLQPRIMGGQVNVPRAHTRRHPPLRHARRTGGRHAPGSAGCGGRSNAAGLGYGGGAPRRPGGRRGGPLSANHRPFFVTGGRVPAARPRLPQPPRRPARRGGDRRFNPSRKPWRCWAGRISQWSNRRAPAPG